MAGRSEKRRRLRCVTGAAIAADLGVTVSSLPRSYDDILTLSIVTAQWAHPGRAMRWHDWRREMFKKTSRKEAFMTLGRLALRMAVGGFFVGHGTQKLFGWFGGGGLEKTGQGFQAMGLAPGRRNALGAGLAEAGGGALLLAGLATPMAAAALIAVMTTAIRTVHLKNGPWNTNGGYEYPVVMIATLLALADAGPGALSLDDALGIERHGAPWLATALALGLAGSYAATELGRRNMPAPVVEDESLAKAT